MRKGMLFFSQYRTLRRIFLKNLKKYLRFVGPYRPGAFFLQDGVLRPTVWPLDVYKRQLYWLYELSIRLSSRIERRDAADGAVAAAVISATSDEN